MRFHVWTQRVSLAAGRHLALALEQQGLGGTVRSWVGTGANQAISPDQIHQAFGSDTVKALAAKVGLSPDVLAAKLSQVLPQAIDHLTPGGAVPKA